MPFETQAVNARRQIRGIHASTTHLTHACLLPQKESPMKRVCLPNNGFLFAFVLIQHTLPRAANVLAFPQHLHISTSLLHTYILLPSFFPLRTSSFQTRNENELSEIARRIQRLAMNMPFETQVTFGKLHDSAVRSSSTPVRFGQVGALHYVGCLC